jgi:hypothetical protein
VLAHRERFEDTLRHEVGHAVHEARPRLVDDWLWSRFGWAIFPTSAQGVDDWIAQMGPGSGYVGLNPAAKAHVRALVRQAAGPGERWGPSTTPDAPPGSPWRDDPRFGPRLAFERSGTNWHAHSANWYRAGDKAFAVNFWYAALMCVDIATLDFVERHMPDDYAAMSPAEFFAELYALYYDPDDPRRARIPADVMAWMDRRLGRAEATQPARPASASSRTSVTRPRRPRRNQGQREG